MQLEFYYCVYPSTNVRLVLVGNLNASLLFAYNFVQLLEKFHVSDILYVVSLNKKLHKAHQHRNVMLTKILNLLSSMECR
jgi:hypothetical protein